MILEIYVSYFISYILVSIKSCITLIVSMSRSIFTEMTSMNSLIVQSLTQAQRMVAADRASLFLIDTKTNQLYAK